MSVRNLPALAVGEVQPPQKREKEGMSSMQTVLSKPDHCSHSALFKRGWTEAGIKRFLKSSDKTVPNPHYRSGADMKLYLLSRVEAIESGAEYQSFCETNKKRQKGAFNAVRTKREKLLHRVAGWNIYIPPQHFTDLVQEAISLYNDRRADHSEDGFLNDFATCDSGEEFLNRITVNFLRHRCSPYERKLTEIAGKVGTKEAYILLNQNIFKKIAETHPSLKEECDRQLEEKIRQYLERADYLYVQ